MNPLDLGDSTSSDNQQTDHRVYLPYPEGWKAHVKMGWEKQYCYAKSPGEDYFHLVMNGEVYLEHGHEMYCLTCAMRQGILSQDRLNWQNPSRKNDLPKL